MPIVNRPVMLWALVAASFAITVPAYAASVTTLMPGQLIDPNAATDGLGGGLADFDSPASATVYQSSSPAQGPFILGIAAFSGDGILMKNPGQDALGLYAEPAGDTTQYLTVRPFVSATNGVATETVTFGGNKYGNLGLYWGSMDTYNSIVFYLGSALIDTVTGTQAAAAIMPPASAVGNQASDSNNRYVVIGQLLNGGLFDRIVLTSSQNSFELDNLAWGSATSQTPLLSQTPLPAALPLFAGGLSALALLARRRKQKQFTE